MATAALLEKRIGVPVTLDQPSIREVENVRLKNIVFGGVLGIFLAIGGIWVIEQIREARAGRQPPFRLGSLLARGAKITVLGEMTRSSSAMLTAGAKWDNRRRLQASQRLLPFHRSPDGRGYPIR